jgi:hypothetical protein
MLGDLCCWHRQETSGSVPNSAATVSSRRLVPTYQTTRCHTPEDLIKMRDPLDFQTFCMWLCARYWLSCLRTVDTDVLLADRTVAKYAVWLLLRRHTKETEEFSSSLKQDIENLYYFVLYTVCMGRDSSVGIATRYELDGPGDRNPVAAIFSAPVQNGPGAQSASWTMGTGSFPRVKRPGRGVDHPPPSGAEVKERVQLYI